MKILILGGSGMLGHRLWTLLRKNHEAWVTIRGHASEFPDSPDFPRNLIRPDVDALNFDQITRALASIQPEIVINCIGLIKQMGHLARDPLFSLSLNAMLPHRISMICRVAKIRMIHISTDCVFSGKKGNYTEEDQSDAEDLYGRTKFLGEVSYPHCVTLRTSIIGRELKNKLGLIEWFLAQKGEINGFRKAIYSGFTTDEIANIIENYILPNPSLSGMYHVSSNQINKYDLLTLAQKTFKRDDIIIQPEDNFVIDRSLNSDKFRIITGYTPPTWEKMISDLGNLPAYYD